MQKIFHHVFLLEMPQEGAFLARNANRLREHENNSCIIPLQWFRGWKRHARALLRFNFDNNTTGGWCAASDVLALIYMRPLAKLWLAAQYWSAVLYAISTTLHNPKQAPQIQANERNCQPNFRLASNQIALWVKNIIYLNFLTIAIK